MKICYTNPKPGKQHLSSPVWQNETRRRRMTIAFNFVYYCVRHLDDTTQLLAYHATRYERNAELTFIQLSGFERMNFSRKLAAISGKLWRAVPFNIIDVADIETKERGLRDFIQPKVKLTVNSIAYSLSTHNIDARCMSFILSSAAAKTFSRLSLFLGF